MTPLRPSILATPSPTSRTTPTFDVVVLVLSPLIWVSSSCRMLLMRKVGLGESKGGRLGVGELGFEAIQALTHGTVDDVAADFDPQPAEQFRRDLEFRAQA